MSVDSMRTFLDQVQTDLTDASGQLDKLELLADWGTLLPAFPGELISPQSKVSFCASSTYLHLSNPNPPQILLQATSDAAITRGYLYILTTALNHLTLLQLLTQSPPLIRQFADQTNINYSTLPSRFNAFSNFFQLTLKQAQKL